MPRIYAIDGNCVWFYEYVEKEQTWMPLNRTRPMYDPYGDHDKDPYRIKNFDKAKIFNINC